MVEACAYHETQRQKHIYIINRFICANTMLYNIIYNIYCVSYIKKVSSTKNFYGNVKKVDRIGCIFLLLLITIFFL